MSSFYRARSIFSGKDGWANPPMKVGSYATTIRVCKWVDADLWLVEMKICQHAMITSLMIFCCIQGSVLSARFRNADHHYAICWSRINNCHLKPCPHCHRKVRLLPKTARQRRNSATDALFCDKLSHFPATVWTGFNAWYFVTCM